jgi:glutathione S-transferase
MITITAFRWVPPFAQGLVRDLRVRWALEEAGLPYQARLIGPEDQSSPEHLRLQPFGQVPTYQEEREGAERLELFESGAIVMHIAERSEALMPHEEAKRARTRTWMFAALNSIEPHIQNLAFIDLFAADQDWAEQRRPGAVEMVEKRLDQLSAWLDGRPYLEDRFTGGDLLMTSVLRILRHTDLVAKRPALDAYQQRCEARPAFQQALADQMQPFAENAPPAAATAAASGSVR